ncbi:metalloregulator ArsR/SmtB family transcription factor [Sphingomonadaceae bacterium OTU29LAMAA1]|uniref:metalloregulator ArsR/SmtB family transcription factor n=1 Tax=Sphingomonas sp. Leaf37 TaxID=2876552 RepID=UPI001E3FC04C|nr:metalloregulator ArsR/SmtB family transcription factor [Sphingomonas sp. Leaf37]USU03689.1 metalloregulator ArsR/SmtB family transcription factor [Sphingomonadaceae bacterium OTU29LAMAA1]
MDKVFDALAHPTRRRILELLKRGGMTAGELADAFDVSKPTMSGHFARLRDAGLIQGESRGTSTLYTLNLSALEEVMMAFMGRLKVGADADDDVDGDTGEQGKTT